MNAFQSIGFIDKATPQQLQQMVAARNPYSYLALSRLQTIRDNKLKEDAKQPEYPPLSQVIPQQLAQLEHKGIASLPQQAPPPQMPPGMPPGMPPQMPPGLPPQQPPMQSGIGEGMAAAGAAGGLVSFKHGGIAHFQEAGSVYGNPMQNLDEIRARQNLIDKRNKMTDEIRAENAASVANVPMPLRGAFEKAKKNADERLKTTSSASLVPTAAAPIDAPTYMPPQPGQAGLNAFIDYQANKAVKPAEAPKAPGTPTTPGTPGGGFGLPSRGEVDRAIKSESDFYENVLKEQVPKLAFNKAKYDTAAGDVTADTKRLYEQQQKDFPDPNKDFRIELSKLKQANEDEGKQIPHMAMLKMGLSLMSTKSPNFLQAFGEAGGAGLEDYTKAINLQKQQKMKLMEADAHAASAQDARSQNMFGRANSQAMQEKQLRMEAFRAEADANAATVGLQVQYLGAKAKLPLDSIKMQRELAVAGAQIHQAYKEQKPEMQKLYELVSTNPGFAKFFQTQKDAAEIKDISDNIIAAHSRAVKIAEDAGKEPPDKNKFYNEWMSIVLNGRRATQEPSNSSSPLRPINFGSQPQQNMSFFNQPGR